MRQPAVAASRASPARQGPRGTAVAPRGGGRGPRPIRSRPQPPPRHASTCSESCSSPPPNVCRRLSRIGVVTTQRLQNAGQKEIVSRDRRIPHHVEWIINFYEKLFLSYYTNEFTVKSSFKMTPLGLRTLEQEGMWPATTPLFQTPCAVTNGASGR